MASSTNISTCRTCLKTSKRPFNYMYSTLGNDKLISDILMEETSIKVFKEDGLPTTICDSCLRKLYLVREFRALVIDSDIKLHDSNKGDLNLEDSNNVNIKVEVDDDGDEAHDPLSDTSNNIRVDNFVDVNRLDDSSAGVSGFIQEKQGRHASENVKIKDEYKEGEGLIDEHGSSEKMFMDDESDMEDDLETHQGATQSKTLIRHRDLYETLKDSNLSLVQYSKRHRDLLLNYVESMRGVEKDPKEIQVLKNKIIGFVTTFIRKWKEYHPEEVKINDIEELLGQVIETYYDESVTSKDCTEADDTRKIKATVKKKRHICDICNKAFAHPYLLRYHRVRHEPDSPHGCDICGKSFKTLKGLTHHKLIHEDDKKYKCHLCPKMYTQHINLTRHLTVHSGEKAATCEICGKSFALKGDLIYHIQTHKEKNLPCHICGKKFRTDKNVSAHVAQVHIKEKNFKCDLCDKTFVTPQELKRHQLTHTGEKPFSCTICGKSFRQRSCIMRHMLTHTGETPYSCDRCSEKFRFSNQLANHMKKHESE